MSYELLRPLALPTHRCVRLGLSGGIGAGKSTVGAIWKEMGVAVISADDISRELLQVGAPVFEQIVQRFGSKVLSDGVLDRQKLADIVFDDPLERRWLESVTHPLIRQRALEFLHKGQPGEVRVYDIPLLAETGAENDFDIVVIVEATLSLRLKYLRQGRGISEAEALRRINSQANDAQRRRLAHIVINNTSSVTELSETAVQVMEYVKAQILENA